MEKRYAYKIFAQERLIVKYYKGQMGIKDLAAFVHETVNDTEFDPTMPVINDFRDAELLFDEKDVIKFVEHMRQQKKLYAQRNITFITHTPNQTVFTVMLELFGKDKVIGIQTFTTIKAAMNWLSIPLDLFKKINDTIEELKNTTCI